MSYSKPTAALAAAVGLTLGGCNFAPLDRANASINSADYVSSDAREVRAFVYGQTTVLQFKAFPAVLVIRDDQNLPVPFTRIDNHARLARRLSDFTIWANGQQTTFAAVVADAAARPQVAPPQTQELAQARPCKDEEAETARWLASLAEQATVGDGPAKPAKPAEVAGIAAQFVARCKAQLAALWDALSGSQAATAGIRDRLNDQTEKLDSGVSVTLHVTFAPGAFLFSPDDGLAAEILQAAGQAPRIYVRGFTDGMAENRADTALAAQRADNARQWLVARGVDASKIRAVSQGVGGWIAPNITATKGNNRRVEVEFIHP